MAPACSGQPLPLHTPYLCSTMDAVHAKGNKVVTCSLMSSKKALLLRVAWVPLEMEGWYPLPAVAQLCASSRETDRSSLPGQTG